MSNLFVEVFRSLRKELFCLSVDNDGNDEEKKCLLKRLRIEESNGNVHQKDFLNTQERFFSFSL